MRLSCDNRVACLRAYWILPLYHTDDHFPFFPLYQWCATTKTRLMCKKQISLRRQISSRCNIDKRRNTDDLS
jgi:hypothetical protein